MRLSFSWLGLVGLQAFINDLLSTYNVSGTVLRSGDIKMNKTLPAGEELSARQ